MKVLPPELTIDLTGRTAIVTGGAQGLGASTAQYLAAAGAIVYIVDVNGRLAEATAGVLAALTLDVRAAPMDVTDRDAVRAVCARVTGAHGRLDILVNNAAVLAREYIVDITDDSYRQAMDVDLHGTLICTQEAGVHMRAARRGAIVNMSSITAVMAMRQRGAYALAKAAVRQLTAVTAREWAEFGIRVNAIAPGVMITPLTADLLNGADATAQYLSRIPLGRYGRPEDVGALCAFLVSDLASYITGQTIVTDGGYTLGTDWSL